MTPRTAHPEVGVKLPRLQWVRGIAGRRHFTNRSRCAAFTLIEIMIVVGIMGFILAAGVPTMYRLMHREGFRKTVSEIVEVCNSARSQAILQSTPIDVMFYPQDGRCEVAGASGPSGGLVRATRIDRDTTFIEMLDVNLTEYKDAESARVRFYPNGTCDELTLVLRSDKGEWRKISLEITTGLVRPVESDPNKWK
jgi:prepilin-type N-terminal cleavage/methylation domain-containing protein